MSDRLNLVVPDDMLRLIEEMRDQSLLSDDMPRMNKSDVARHLIRTGIENSEHVEDVVPEHDLIAYRRDELKRENKLRDWRAGFKTRVKRNFTRRFKNGYTPDELAEFAIGMRDEARILWHDDDDPEHVERRREAIDYIDQVVDEARTSYEQSTHDPLDPEELFSSFSGVEDGVAQGRIEEIELERHVRLYLKDMIRQGNKNPDPQAVATKIANELELEENLVREVVDDVDLEEIREELEVKA